MQRRRARLRDEEPHEDIRPAAAATPPASPAAIVSPGRASTSATTSGGRRRRRGAASRRHCAMSSGGACGGDGGVLRLDLARSRPIGPRASGSSAALTRRRPWPWAERRSARCWSTPLRVASRRWSLAAPRRAPRSDWSLSRRRRRGVREVGLRLLDLRRLGALPGGWRAASSGLTRAAGPTWSRAARSAASSWVEQQRAPGVDLGRRAATGSVVSRPRLGRSDLDEVGLRVALPLHRRRGAIEPPPGTAGACENDQRKNRHLATGHRSSPPGLPLDLM